MRPRVMLLAVFIVFFSIAQAFAEDRDANAGDLTGIPKSHKYTWAVVGGTALGAGIGVIAPGGTKSAFKGALLGGSLTSAFYLAKNPRAAEGHRSFAHIITNTALGTGIIWTICNCTSGAWAGALVGGGGTAIIQAFKTRHSAIADKSPGPSDEGAQLTADLALFGEPSLENGASPESLSHNKKARPLASESQSPQAYLDEQLEIKHY